MWIKIAIWIWYSEAHDTERFLLDAIENYFIYVYKESNQAKYNQHMNTVALQKRHPQKP